MNVEVELVDGVLDAVVPPAQVGERRLLQLLLGEGALRRQHRHAETEEGGIAVLHRPAPGEGAVAEQALSTPWWKRLSSTLEAALQRVVPAQAG